MSTRATYSFSVPQVVIYIHYDGYPSGAAWYFYKALTHPNQRGLGPEQMIRANDLAELTTDHEDHGDTEFRYDVKGWGPDAELVVSMISNNEWKTTWTGNLADFIHTHLQGEPGYFPFKTVDLKYSQNKFNLITARQKFCEGDLSILKTIKTWMKHGMNKGANWDWWIANYCALVTAFPELKDEEVERFLRNKGSNYGNR
mgnify:CR=1 FL=1